MADVDLKSHLQTATNRYLSTISAVGDCLAEACPAVGGPYRHQFTRMRARLAFDSTPAAIEQSSIQLQAGLKQYATQASEHLERHRTELLIATETLEEVGQMLARRQEAYHSRLRKLVDQMVRSPLPLDSEELRDSITRQAVSLATALESFSHETQALVTRILDETKAIEARVAESETTDPITKLTNRREMERQIERHRDSGEQVTLLRYRAVGQLPNEVAREIAIRLTSQFRPHDVVARWEPNEFLVLFKGPVEIAERRVNQVLPWISGKFPLENGEVVQVQVEAEMMENVLAIA